MGKKYYNFTIELQQCNSFFQRYQFAMASKHLQEKFIEALLEKYPRKASLSLVIADILKIERESAIRRLSNRVNFTIDEMGILAQKLNISIDPLLFSDTGSTIISLRLHQPNSIVTLKDYLELVVPYLQQIERASYRDIEMGAIFNALPLEFLVPYPNLCKFYYFKLGRYSIGTKEFSNFNRWEIPDYIKSFLDRFQQVYNRASSIFYIWNYITLINLINDIKYFHAIDIINNESLAALKEETHHFLYNIEDYCGENKPWDIGEQKISIYISKLDLGMSHVYHYRTSNGDCTCFLRSFFTYSFQSANQQSSLSIKDWICSMKSVSTLVSGTGEKERVLFFKEQHALVDSLGKI